MNGQDPEFEPPDWPQAVSQWVLHSAAILAIGGAALIFVAALFAGCCQ